MLENEAGEVENYTLQVENRTELNLKFWIDKPNFEVNGESENRALCTTIINDRTMVPFRNIAEAFGAEVEWIAATRTVVMKLMKQG
ncbi:MAG: stalk domain-containing protein [Caldisericia bacterium]